MSNSWQCPFCNHYSIITSDNKATDSIDLSIDNKHGYVKAVGTFMVCPNPDCDEYIFRLGLWKATEDAYGSLTIQKGGLIKYLQVVPSSNAKVFPTYIPKQIRDNYLEACEILDLSPKASATLARRCLQGMIRNFWKVKGKKSLWEEIEAIKDKIDPMTLSAIDAVRSVGNIGAHMEQDINLIVDIEPNEAEKLITLIETLIKDWYINSHEREQRLEEIQKIVQKKNKEKEGKSI